MSKTRRNGIALQAGEDETAALIRRAPTDSDRHITYDPEGRPAVAGLLDLLAACTGEDPRDLADQVGSGGAGRLKQQLTEAVNELLRPMRRRRAALVRDPSSIDAILAAGNARARAFAEETLSQVHDRLGMPYANVALDGLEVGRGSGRVSGGRDGWPVTRRHAAPGVRAWTASRAGGRTAIPWGATAGPMVVERCRAMGLRVHGHRAS